VTLIGAIKCGDGVVLLADRQETITDYAKWDVNKIAHFELANQYRCLMAGSGDSDTIDMVKQHVIAAWSGSVPSSANTVIGAITKKYVSADDLRPLILQVVKAITKKCIIPWPRSDRPYVDLIWAIQRINSPLGPESIDLFRTCGLTVQSIDKFFFTGSPLLLARYLSDLYLKDLILMGEEAEALASYILWECKEYDPNVGKHSDIVTLKHDGTISRVDRISEQYWEEHFAHFKKSLQLLPLLSCASSAITKSIYPQEDHLQRFKVALTTLAKEQQKMRDDSKPRRTKLGEALNKNLRKAALKFLDQEQARLKRSSAQKSKDQQ
jgi:hypothetical protein